jgi:hypothetical protein
MTERELSYQQFDPVGSYSARPVTVLISVEMVLIACAITLQHWPEVTSPIAAGLAVVVCVVVAVVTSYWSDPLRAPFGRGSLFTVLGLDVLMLGLAITSTWGTVDHPFMRWAPIVVGLSFVQLSSLRPPRELIALTILGSITAGVVIVVRPQEHGIPTLVSLMDAALPVIALGCGGAAYATVMARSMGRWYSPTAVDDRAAESELRERVVRSVHGERIDILSNTVVPFFTELLAGETLTDADRDQATAIATSIRSAMLAEVDRSWLDVVVDQAAGERADESLPGSEVVQDHERRASRMTTEQRIVMRALIFALFAHPGFDPDGFAVVITGSGSGSDVVLSAKLDADDSIPRSGLAAYFAVLRIAFDESQVSFQPPMLTLRFSYGHR